ncbi:hypothetical protein [Streptomyces sp. NPDC005969]|uniref:hypothetical protein n=1 Tax=Streptomyces sp. NPDC005969 TaxID=3156722 RepID=UPI0033E43D21
MGRLEHGKRRTPGSGAGSSAQSRLRVDTARNGPAWIFPRADTSPRITSVTVPARWLRAEDPLFVRSVWRNSRSKEAGSGPRIIRRPSS